MFLEAHIKTYVYATLLLIVGATIIYIGYVFYDRNETKKELNEKKVEVKTIKVESAAGVISAKAKGKIEQVDKEPNNEADTSFGVHYYTF